MTESVPASTRLTPLELSEIRARKQVTGAWPERITTVDGDYLITLEDCTLTLRPFTTDTPSTGSTTPEPDPTP